MKTLKYFFSIIILSLLVVACEKSHSSLNMDDVNLADDDAVTEVIFDDIYSTADNAVQLVESFMLKYPGAKGTGCHESSLTQ